MHVCDYRLDGNIHLLHNLCHQLSAFLQNIMSIQWQIAGILQGKITCLIKLASSKSHDIEEPKPFAEAQSYIQKNLGPFSETPG